MDFLVKDKEFYKKLLIIGCPVAAQQCITVGVNLMDTIMLGQVTETALAASSMATQVHNLFHYMSMGMGMGSAVMIARFWGAKDEQSLKKTLTLMYRIVLLIATLFTIAVAVAPEFIMSLLTNEEAAAAEGVRYLKWTIPCFILHGLTQTTTIVLRNSKQLKIPLYAAIGAFALNIVANWIFIFGKFGAPAMGIAGAALGTTLSRIFEFVIVCGFMFFKDEKIRFRIRDIFAPAGDLLKEYLKISIPVMVSDTLLGTGNSVVVSISGHISQTFMAAMTITNVIQQTASIFSVAIGQAAVILIGNTLGEGKREEAQKVGYTFVALGLLLSLFMGILIWIFGPAMIAYYKVSEETAAVALELMHAVSFIAGWFLMGSILTKGILRGGGDTRFLMVADILFLWLVSVPLGYAAGIQWSWTPALILCALRIDNLIKAIWCFFRLRSGKWVKKIKGVKELSKA